MRIQLGEMCFFFDLFRVSDYCYSCNNRYINSADALNMSRGLEMSALKTLKKLNNFKLKVLAATLLLIAGFSIWLYATSVIQGYTQLLNSSTLTQEEVWSYEGSLQWWQSTYTTILPATAVMMAVGVIGLLGPVFWARIQRRYALRTFTNELEFASTERFEIE